LAADYPYVALHQIHDPNNGLPIGFFIFLCQPVIGRLPHALGFFWKIWVLSTETFGYLAHTPHCTAAEILTLGRITYVVALAASCNFSRQVQYGDTPPAFWAEEPRPRAALPIK